MSAFPSSPSIPDRRAMCKFGSQCYQKNPMHREKFRHPSEDDAPKEKKLKTVDKNDKENEDSHVKNVNEESGDNKCDYDTFNVKEKIKFSFLTTMPPDFYSFWEFCKERHPERPQEALLETTGLILVGPFEILAGTRSFKDVPETDRLCHFRYYYDPPEFLTVLACKDKPFHIGYFRDDPAKEDKADLVSSNDPLRGCSLNQLGDNLFGAVYNHLSDLIQSSGDPFAQTQLEKLKASVHAYATFKCQNEDYSLDKKTAAMKSRERRKQSSLFHGAGMVVPYDKENDVGYREIPESVASLKRIFKNIVEAKTEDEKAKAMDVLHELITNVQFANDEADPGMGVELGLQAFLYGGEALHGPVKHLLTMGYEMIDRPIYAKIIAAHLQKRKDTNKEKPC